MFEDVARTLRTARHLKASQVGHRLYRGPKRAALRRWGPGYLRWIRRSKAVPRIGGIPRYRGRSALISGAGDGGELDAALLRARQVVEGRFFFLSHEESWQHPIDWTRKERNLLWQYALHSFEYGVDLGILSLKEPDGESGRVFRALVDSWVADNPCGQSVGWDAYPTSKRIVSWICAFRLFGETLERDAPFVSRFLDSLSDQVLFLERNPELHLRGNHLWENYWALTLAGLFFETVDGARWHRTGSRVLWEQVREQILPDGGHFERSPHYHCVLLKSLLEAKMAWEDAGFELPEDIEGKLIDMLDFLDGILYPDGEIPLVNDAVRSDLVPRSLLQTGAVLLADGRFKCEGESLGLWPLLWLGEEGRRVFDSLPAGRSAVSAAFPASGYFVCRAGGWQMLMDAGPLGPDYQPGHGHADTLSFELSRGPLRFVVDSGVSEYYGEQAWRGYERGTRAHNTVEVDGQDQSEVWSRFRVGRRARPRTVRMVADEGMWALRASHDGYEYLAGRPIHTRTVLRPEDDFWLFVDEIGGGGVHRCVSRVHLHPECDVERSGDLSVCVTRGGVTLSIVWAPGVELGLRRGEVRPIQGWVASAFGSRRAAWVVEATSQGRLPVIQAFAVVLEERGPLFLNVEARARPVILGMTGRSGGRRFEIGSADIVSDGYHYKLINQ